MEKTIKSATVFLGSWSMPELEQMREALTNHLFEPCGPTETMKSGFVPVQPGGDLVVIAAGYRVVRVMIETKAVPGPIVEAEVNLAVQKIEAEQGIKVGKKMRREIKEDVIKGLLPKAFPKTSSVYLLMGNLDSEGVFVLADSTTESKVDTAIGELINALEFKGPTRLPKTEQSPAFVMSSWLLDENTQPKSFSTGQSAKLVAQNKELGGTIALRNERLNREEIRRYLNEGRSVTELEIIWQDRISFKLTEDLKLKKIEFKEAVFNDAGVVDPGGPESQALEANIAIIGNEFDCLLPEIFEAFGGVTKKEGAKE